MSIDLTGITNKNEYYTNHYFATVFEENTNETISKWNIASRENEKIRTPWSLLRQNARQYYAAHDRFVRSSMNLQTLNNIRTLANSYLNSLGYPEAKPGMIAVDDNLTVPIYLEMTKSNGAPLLWVVLSASEDKDTGIMESFVFNSDDVEEDTNGAISKGLLSEIPNEDLANKIFFGAAESPRFLIIIGMNQIALLDRNKWNEKRYLQFELEEIFSRLENTTLQAMSVLLHKDSLCPDDGKILLDELDEQSQKNASGVSQNLKYALRESIEILGNEVLYDMAHHMGRNLESDPVNAGQLTLECLRYMYRMLFVLFIESRPELGYTPIKEHVYHSGYSLESLRDIADNIRDDIKEVGDGFYLHETIAKLFELIYDGYPKTEEELTVASTSDSLHDIFLIAPLKAHIFDPEYTTMITSAKLRNSCMLRIIDLMSLTRSTGKRNDRRGRISYANLGINQMGAVYEALLSYRGFIAEHDLYEVKRAGDAFNELDVGYFVSESELDQYSEDERVRYESGEKKGKLRMYTKGTFIYRLAGREREKSASYYTPEVLTKCLVKYALKELLEGKTADEILNLTVCEPAMGSAAFLNEAINQLAEAYVSRKEQETGNIISYDKRFNELQKVKMFIADRNVYGIDLNPIAVELAEVSLWLNTIFKGGYVPWFGTQLVNGNSLIGARRQVYTETSLQATSKGMRWYENEPERVPLGQERKKKKGFSQIYHFLLGDPGMCSYSDKVIKSLEPENIKKMVNWNKKFIEPISDNDLVTLMRLSSAIDSLWESQIKLQKEIEAKTQDSLSIYGHEDTSVDSHTTIRQKDQIFNELYKSEHMKNAGPYARLKFAMDYWCSLWFWPIDKADLLPSRSEFLFDMSLILEGTMTSVNLESFNKNKQYSLYPSEKEEMAKTINQTYGIDSVVDIPALRRENPRLNLAYEIAEQNHFMHWELEFADLFAERGGFDLIIGNPPWILMGWNEQAVLSDTHPMFAVKKLTATQTTQHRVKALENQQTKEMYFREYESMSGTQGFLNAIQNYADLIGMKANLYKCFLPQAWMFTKKDGVSAFVHPEGVYDDPKGNVLRAKLYPRLRKHFMFINEQKLFLEVDHHTEFSLNIYAAVQKVHFDTISNLYAAGTIDECYELPREGNVPGIKNDDGEWNVVGHPDRIIKVTSKDLPVFADLFSNTKNADESTGVRLPELHAMQIMEVMEHFSEQTVRFRDRKQDIYSTQMLNETSAQDDGIISLLSGFPLSLTSMVYSGPLIGLSNPYAKSANEPCLLNSDYQNIDLLSISENYCQRTKYCNNVRTSEFVTPWGINYEAHYRIYARKMIDPRGERTLISAIVPPGSTHINGLIGFAFREQSDLPFISALWSSVPVDFFVKTLNKANFLENMTDPLPVPETKLRNSLAIRSLRLNCLTVKYSTLWENSWTDDMAENTWAKNDGRLSSYSVLCNKWEMSTPLRNDFERRQALVEIDVLSAMAIGMSLEQLKTIYQIQFPVMRGYESDTWYDANGRIVFTTNRSMVGVGYDRKTWESEVKGAPAGKKFYRTITDDTMPGGPVERTIEYVAPFDRCDREQDYETAWKFFEEKYGE